MDCEVDPWVVSRKGEIGSCDVFIGGCHSPNIVHISARRQLTSFGIFVQKQWGCLFGRSLLAGRLVKVKRKGKRLCNPC